ncbi:MAG TPA: hypothetical protein VJH24_02490 [Candidatus Bilamarchaeaceae archaeon]|nr:hypothetical protein [Candidatus Bilamarchaeaceae archaeon]
MVADKEILSMNVKKIVPWATGFAVFVTKEAKALNWTDKDHVIITSFMDDKGGGIEIRRAPIKRK